MSQNTPQNLKDLKVSVMVLADLFELTDRRVQQLAKEGIIPKEVYGKYPLFASIKGFLKYQKDGRYSADTSGNDTDHKKRLLKAKADKAEIEAERLADNLIEVHRVEKTWTDIMSRVRPKLLSIAPKSAAVVAVETSADACHKIIQKSVDEALIELSSTHIETEIDEDEQASRTEAIINGDTSSTESSLPAADDNG